MPEDIQMPNGDFLKNYPEVTRVEVVSREGREFVRYECSNVQVSLQDDGQTIKVFLFTTYHDDVGEDTPWLDCADGFKDLPDEDADLIDSGSRVG
jgi:hypothetical protein